MNNLFVCVKNAVDESELRADASSGAPLLQSASMKMSTFDRNAVEEAIRTKEKTGGSITALTLGTQDSSRKTIKEAMAMGCDRAIAIIAAAQLDALSTSYYLARAIRVSGQPADLVFTSEGSSDVYDGVVGAMLAKWLDLPFIGYVRKLDIRPSQPAGITCEIAMEESLRVVESSLPAVVSVVSEINTPRYPTLLQVMQASKKPIQDVTVESLRDERAPVRGVEVTEVKVQMASRRKILLEGPADQTAPRLVDALKKEGVL